MFADTSRSFNSFAWHARTPTVAPGLDSRPGNLAKSPATQIGFSSEDCPHCFALFFRVLSASECYYSA